MGIPVSATEWALPTLRHHKFIDQMDIFGQALLDYHYHKLTSRLWLHNNYGPPEDMPVDVFFRSEHDMPELELIALNLSHGKILDIGAGVGSHALALQNRGADVTALEISAAACGIMWDRGVQKIINADILTFSTGTYDTLLLLMNGIGLAGTLSGLAGFLAKAKTLLNPGGSLLFDSSNISYLYDDIELPREKYYGEISFRYEYKGQFGEWFNWLYIDADLLKTISEREGWEMELLFDDGMDQFLVRLKPVNSPQL